MSYLLNSIPTDPVIDRFIELSYEVSERIIRLLNEKGMLQRDLAIKLGKKDSEISKWLQGNHNLTLRTIASIEVALDEKIIKVQGLDVDHTFSESINKPTSLLLSSRLNVIGVSYPSESVNDIVDASGAIKTTKETSKNKQFSISYR